MQFGMFFEHQLPRPWGPHDERDLFTHALEWAELGEQAGISYAWAQEHHFLEEYSHSTAPEVFLGAVSQRTTRMRLGHGIALMPPPYNHPVRVAERIATLDLVSNGRVEWGTGESSSRLELDGFGVPYIEKRAMWTEAVHETVRMIAADPYPGYEGRFFSMPARTVVPKPVQRPHPPLWVACTSRETLRLAASLGLGALTFAFMDADEAKFWVDDYYEAFEAACHPIGLTVNPNVAVLAGVTCHSDREVAIRRGVEGQRFFKWALAYYFRFGSHVPGHSRLWDEFTSAPVEAMAGLGAVGNPEDLRDHLRSLEAAGVDQVIFLQQAGRYEHEHICETLQLLGTDVFPEFLDRQAEAEVAKAERLAPAVAQAMAHVDPLPPPRRPEPVEAYPVLWERHGADGNSGAPARVLDAASVWKLHVAGANDGSRVH
jgi:alkanesulfonate monooxygenase SsuD/methylene tetrahydromethanopterin reductase-like flavin-dependent oxidoreductase (luciferase family)